MTNIESMKLFVVLSLASVAIGGMDYEMTQKWQKLKAMESCWGEENMKLVMVDMKKAIAKCSHEDAPELSLPPYRSAYRFTNYNSYVKKDDKTLRVYIFAGAALVTTTRNYLSDFPIVGTLQTTLGITAQSKIGL